VAINANESSSRQRATQNQSVKDSALAVISLLFYLLALGASVASTLFPDAMQLGAG